MLDLKYPYLTLLAIPFGYWVKVRIIKDHGLQEFENKEKKFQLVVQILDSNYSISKKRTKDELLGQIILSKSQRVKIAKMRELSNLEGVTLTIQHEGFRPFGRRKLVEFLAFRSYEMPGQLKQETLHDVCNNNLLNDVVCRKPLEAPNQ